VTENLAAFAYLVASVCFILALKGLASPESARTGNLTGVIGMVIAIGTTLVMPDVLSYGTIFAGVVIGGAIGPFIALRIQMTALPQLVAVFHSLVGMAAVLVAAAALYAPEAYGIGTVGGIKAASLIEMSIGTAIGAITFTGSVVAFAKLQGLVGGSPLVFPGQHPLNALIAIGIVALTVHFAMSESYTAFWALAVYVLSPGDGGTSYVDALKAKSALVCVPLAFYLMLERRPRWERLYCLACLILTLLAVTLAASRGGFLGLAIALLYVVWRSRQRVRNLVLACALLLPLSLAAPSSPVERFLHPKRGETRAVENRKALWEAGLKMIWANPVLGIGLGNFKALVGQYAEREETPERMAHNSYLEIAAETGLPGFLVFLGVLFWSFRTLEQVRRRTLRSSPSLLHQAALGIQGVLLGFSVAIFFISGQ